MQQRQSSFDRNLTFGATGLKSNALMQAAGGDAIILSSFCAGRIGSLSTPRSRIWRQERAFVYVSCCDHFKFLLTACTEVVGEALRPSTGMTVRGPLCHIAIAITVE